MTRIVVDLPAPFGPTKPVTWPGVTLNVMPSRARAGPNRLRSPVTSIVASMAAHATAARWRGSSRRRAVFASPLTGVPNGCGVPLESYRDCAWGEDAAAAARADNG